MYWDEERKDLVTIRVFTLWSVVTSGQFLDVVINGKLTCGKKKELNINFYGKS